MNNKKRANKKQREVLLERLHTNIEIVRGNQADEQAVEFWASLASELNVLGCSRTVQEWQHIWNVWVSKTKTKARKIRRSQNATGGGPGIDADLNDTESKILDVVGSACIFGHDSIELGILPLQTAGRQAELNVPCTSSQALGEHGTSSACEDDLPAVTPSVSQAAPHSDTEPAPSQPDQYRTTLRQSRSSRGRYRRTRNNEALVQALNANGQAWREAILEAAHVIAAAIRSLGPQSLSPNPQP